VPNEDIRPELDWPWGYPLADGFRGGRPVYVLSLEEVAVMPSGALLVNAHKASYNPQPTRLPGRFVQQVDLRQYRPATFAEGGRVLVAARA
jgi:hypothetical protein